ncbi:MAG: hypothetical protein CVU56_07550 [Deltaproteobacteria bacterium HGW-Deltaproteobacteria-14]|jgi:tetratricopeptide (TPR) repeat protein|nr:MAG: hypothetical protein CVU56_07550 [Deltaproteobacteria bacterium HGW-Deltaproteobacteria-14]
MTRSPRRSRRALFTALLTVATLAAWVGGAAAAEGEGRASDTAPGAAAGGGGAQGTAAERFEAGNRLYLQGRYADAVRVYAALHEELRIEDPVLYHNLGDACFRSEAYGSAILYYKRGLRLDPPADVADALTANLDAARRTLQTRYHVAGDKSQFVYAEAGGLVYKATHVLGRTPLAVLFAGFWTVLLLLLVLRRLRPTSRGFGRAAVPVALATVLIGLMFWGQVYTDSTYRVGVIVVDAAKLRDGKDVRAQGKDIPEGMEVRIVERDTGWTRIELNSGLQGWVEDDAIRQI